MDNVYILSGPVKSGKTTRLSNWIKKQNKIEGIIQPVINDRRCIQNVSTGKTKLLEIAGNEADEELLKIGKYIFSKKVFEWANLVLLESLESSPDWLVIDEFGKLELEGNGIEPSLTKLLKLTKGNTKLKILIVVRDYLLADFLNYYSFDKNEIHMFNC